MPGFLLYWAICACCDLLLVSRDIDVERSERRSPPGFPGGPVVKNSPTSARDTGSIPAPERSHVPQVS